MNAVEIVRDFHLLNDENRAAVLAGGNKGLAKEIAELPDDVRAGVMKAIDQDFDSSGKLKESTGLSLDERVAEKLPSHPFRSGASLPDGVVLDVLGKAHELEVPGPDAAFQASASGVPDGATAVGRAKDGRPQAVVGDKVKVDGQAGEVIAVEDGYATAIKLNDGSEVSGVKYLYVDAKKAKADAGWQTKK